MARSGQGRESKPASKRGHVREGSCGPERGAALPIVLAYVCWRRTETQDLSWPHPSLQTPLPATQPPTATPGKGGGDVPALRSKVLESPFQALHTVSKRRARKAGARRCWQGHSDGWGERPAPALGTPGIPAWLSLPDITAEAQHQQTRLRRRETRPTPPSSAGASNIRTSSVSRLL